MNISHLPHQPTVFIGRESELGEVASLLADPGCRLITLVGPGGIGKTRLVLEVARRLADSVSPTVHMNIYFVPLQPLTSPDFIIPAIAEAVDFQFYPVGEPRQQLFNYFHEKTLLLVLDNFEHLLDGAGIVSDLLAYAPSIKVLATSRERLNLIEEWVFEVDGLAVPPSEENCNIETYSAVALFVQHARRVNIGFNMNPLQKSAVAHICRLVGGMPLGIELAAAWIRALSPEQIATELERSLDLLETPARNVPPRHRNMQAVFEPTWQRLSDTERAVFMKLSVFRGGFTLDAAQSVAQSSVRILSSLIDKSLLRVNSNERYDLHELLRQYGEQRLNQVQAESEQVRDLHCLHYADFMRLRKDDILRAKGPGNQREGFIRIQTESENVRAMIYRYIEQRKFHEIAEFWDIFERFYDLQSWFQEGEEICRSIVDKVRNSSVESIEEKNRLLGIFLGLQAWFLYRNFKFAEAKHLADESIPLLRAFTNGGERAYMLTIIGASSSDYEAAIPLLEEAIPLAKGNDELWMGACAIQTLAQWHISRGEYEAAKPLANEALALCKQVNDEFTKAYVLMDLGNIALYEQDYRRAEQLGCEARDACATLGFGWGILRADANLGDIALARKDYPQARKRFEECLTIAQDLGIRWFVAFALRGLAKVDFEQGILHEAQKHWVAALEILEEIPRLPQIADLVPSILNGIAALLRKLNHKELAIELIPLILNHPDTSGATRNEAEQLYVQLQAEIPPDIYMAAWERGIARDVTTTIRTLLAEWRPAISEVPSVYRPSVRQSSINLLSERELEVLNLISNGLSNTEIAEQLFLGISTVKKHINHIFSKLDVESRSQALSRAQELHLI